MVDMRLLDAYEEQKIIEGDNLTNNDSCSFTKFKTIAAIIWYMDTPFQQDEVVFSITQKCSLLQISFMFLPKMDTR